MLTPIILSGFLAKRFGKRFELDVRSPREAVRALCIQLPGFERALLEYQPGFRVWADRELLDEENLNRCTGVRPIRIVPVIAGSKSGLTSIILGAALIFAAPYMMDAVFSMGIGTIGADASIITGLQGIGAALIIGGLSKALFHPPTPPVTGSSYLFNGPINTTAQGGCVPLAYGEMVVGSQMVSAGIIPNQAVTPILVTAPGSGSGWNPTLTNAVG